MSSFFAFLSRMKFINRWALMRNTRPENLCEHSYDTAMLTHALCEIGNARLGKNHDVGKCVLVAMYHDASEILTGDMPTPVKYCNEKLVNAYKELESSAESRLVEMLPDDLRQRYRQYISNSDEQVHRIVKAADKIAAYLKCVEELKLGNSEFAAAKTANYEQIKALGCEEAEIFINEFADAYALPLDSLNL